MHSLKYCLVVNVIFCTLQERYIQITLPYFSVMHSLKYCLVVNVIFSIDTIYYPALLNVCF